MRDKLIRRVRRADGTRGFEFVLSREMVRELLPEATEEQLNQFDWPLRVEGRPWTPVSGDEPDAAT